jgi:hypothetical protein
MTMTEDTAAYAHLADNWPPALDALDDWAEGYAFPTLGNDCYGQTGRLGPLAMTLTDWHGHHLTLIARYDASGEPVFGLAVHPGPGRGVWPSERLHAWTPDLNQDQPPAAQPAIVLSPNDLRRLVHIGHALLRSLVLTAAAAPGADA